MSLNAGLMSQSTLVFLFVNVFAGLLLHVSRLPTWLIVFSIFALVWRLSMFSGRLPKPNWFAKLVLVTSGFTGIYFSYGATLTIEGMVSLLIAGVMLKPLEVSKQQDSYLLIFLNYFLCALLFLFERTPLDFLLVLIVMIFTLGAQVLVHFYGQSNRLASLKTGFALLVKSLPLALLLFFVLPRLGPLWTLSIPTQSGVVGLSDSMSPGSIASLGENDKLAFRVKLLDGELPMNQRYWRAFTLSEFDGESWQQGSGYQADFVAEPFGETSQVIRYEVMIEPHEKQWLFSVGATKPLTKGVAVRSDAALQSNRRLYNQWQYQAESDVSPLIAQTSLTRGQRLTYTRLPDHSNPKARAFAQQLKQQAHDLDTYIRFVQSYISNKEFSYTLSPGAFDGDDQIDHFLFESKSGFCSYYAGSLTFLLRAIDVPARVVLGYMGGEENTISKTLSVYQYDAHAWVEVFIDGRGWVRFDPTGWVAPERVESGLQRAIPNEFKGFKSQSQWLKDLRKQWQAFDYLWNEWMLSYKGNKQQAILQDLWGDRSTEELTVIMVSVFMFLGFGLFAFLWWDQISKPVSYEKKIFNMLLVWLNNSARVESLDECQGLTLQSLFKRLQEKHPHLITSLNALNLQINKALYQIDSQGLDKTSSRRILKMIRILKKQSK